MNDHEIANQKIWGGKWKDPPIDQEFKEIKLSKCCRREIEDYWIHNTTICMGCWSLNPEIDETLYQCSLCLEEHEDEECNCYG